MNRKLLKTEVAEAKNSKTFRKSDNLLAKTTYSRKKKLTFQQENVKKWELTNFCTETYTEKLHFSKTLT